MPAYLKQRAAPWVSATVLTGGAMTAVLLFWLVRVENPETSIFGLTGSSTHAELWAE